MFHLKKKRLKSFILLLLQTIPQGKVIYSLKQMIFLINSKILLNVDEDIFNKLVRDKLLDSNERIFFQEQQKSYYQ
jgi:hypothetical protein